MSKEVIKKFIDNFNDFKYTGKLSLEQMVFSLENFRDISLDIEEIVKVINNKTFGDYNQHNLIEYLNTVYNDQIYDLFLKEHKDKKMCYWIINIEFYKIFNLYRILILKANILINGGSINEIIVKDFERTMNSYITESITNIRKALDFLKKNKYLEELLACTHPFKKLLKMDDFGKMVFQRIFPNIDVTENLDIEDDSDDEYVEDSDNSDVDPEIKEKVESILNNLNCLNTVSMKNGQPDESMEAIKSMVKDTLKNAGIDLDLDVNTSFTVQSSFGNDTTKKNNLPQTFTMQNMDSMMGLGNIITGINDKNEKVNNSKTPFDNFNFKNMSETTNKKVNKPVKSTKTTKSTKSTKTNITNTTDETLQDNSNSKSKVKKTTKKNTQQTTNNT